jgi:hypothetical protein
MDTVPEFSLFRGMGCWCKNVKLSLTGNKRYEMFGILSVLDQYWLLLFTNVLHVLVVDQVPVFVAVVLDYDIISPIFVWFNIWTASWLNQHNGFATSMDPDQPAHSRSHGSSDQTARMRRLVWIHAGGKPIMLVLLWRGSFIFKVHISHYLEKLVHVIRSSFQKRL